MSAPARAEVRAIVRYRDNARMVTFDNVGLARAVEALQAEDPPYECGPDLDAPPGRYIVRSRSAQREGKLAYWYIVLDAGRGTPVAAHNCPARASNPGRDIQCRHMAAAWLAWKADHDENDTWLRRVHMSESTALATVGEQRALTPYYLPTERDMKDTMALATTLMTTRGAAIPEALDTPAKVAAVVLAGRELGFDPMTSLRRLYIVDGQTQLDAQGITAKIQEAGGDLIFHCDCETCADVELVYPGRSNKRVKYTLALAVKAGTTGGTRKDGSKWTKPAWRNHPADMLVWRAITRLGKRGAADVINALVSAMVRVDDFGDLAASFQPEHAPVIEVDHETGEITQDAEYTQGESPCLPPSGLESESAPVSTRSENMTSPAQTASTPTPGAARSPAASAGATSASATPTSAPTVAATAATSPATWRSLNYAEAHGDKAKHFQALSDYQKAIRGHGGSVPEAADSMTLGEVADSLTGAA